MTTFTLPSKDTSRNHLARTPKNEQQKVLEKDIESFLKTSSIQVIETPEYNYSTFAPAFNALDMEISL